MDQRFQLLAIRARIPRAALALVLAFFLLDVRAGHAGELTGSDEAALSAQRFVATELPTHMRAFSPQEDARLRFRNTLIIGGGAGLIAAYGLSQWWDTGFSGKFKSASEHWFSSGTEFGGIDKLGHFYSNYGSVRLLRPLFESAGNSREAAVRLAGWSALGIFTGIEVLDGFSKRYKFGPEDTVVNLMGLALGLAMETHPEWDAMFDFRIDYRRSSRSSFDPFGDYEGQKYLLVLKADAFAPMREHKYLRYLEVAVGYGAKGFDQVGAERRRSAYFGLSLNLSRLLADSAYEGRMRSTPFQRGTDVVFDLVQFPTVGYARRSID